MVDDEPSTDSTANNGIGTPRGNMGLNQQQEPGQTNETFDVPQEAAAAGRDTNEPRADSPESLDQELSEGANREDVDPQHSITRPEDIDKLNEEEYGAD